MSEYFSKPVSSGRNGKVKLDLSNYATKSDLTNTEGVDSSKVTKKFDLASSKSEIDKLDISKLETFPVDLSKLIDVVKNEVVKKNVYDNLVKNLMLFRVLMPAVQSEKLTMRQKISKIGKNILYHDHAKYITTQEFNNLTTDNFAARIGQAKITTEDDVADFVKQTNLDYKSKFLIKYLNQKFK